MIAITILYLLCLIPAIVFTKFGLKEGLMQKYGVPGKLIFFLSVWAITPGFFIVYLFLILKRKLSN